MNISGKVYCFFEQSGTFRNEFKKLGMPSEDYDHNRYLEHREEWLKRQREYYRKNKDKYTLRHLAEVYENKKIRL